MDNKTYEELEELIEEWERTAGITLKCGCRVEIDGNCPCGNVSPFVEKGIV